MTQPIAQLGEPVLAQVAEYVRDFDEELQQLVERMMTAMRDADGVGIAAPQIFESKRVAIIASKPSERYPDAPHCEPLVMVNPELLTHGSTQQVGWEGCLSVPGIRGRVKRFCDIRVAYQDMAGECHCIELSGFLARIALHEIDHLNGKTFVDVVADRKDLIAGTVWQQQCR
ncbi:peptide deformylase [Ferrimonas senticii]|uniref:peptide deformylase n=1 Tax=Ferrimonas senticii TaxID=394566 RepID=UPI000400C117|nr:peptide deformylase [Ferrimonas senticii]